MDLKYYDDNSGKWITLKVQSNTDPNNDSTFATPKYIINNLIKKEGDFVKYYDNTILNEKIKLANSQEKNFISNIKLQNNNNGTVILTPTYGGIVVGEGDLVSNVSFHDETGDLEITKIKISKDVLNPISSGLTIPDSNTSGIFYIQIEEKTQNEEDNTTEEDNDTSI